jgi:hypothetical protein
MLPQSHTNKRSVRGISSSDNDLTKVGWEGVTDGAHCLEWQGEGNGPLGLLPQYTKQSILVQN